MSRTLSPWEWILHLDMDSFFAAMEQRDKPSLLGKPVIVGGVGGRGVVATASYEARKYGVHSAMAIATAKRLCPQGVYLPTRFDAYREASALVMGILQEYSRRIEPISIDEAFLDLRDGRDLPRTQAFDGDPVRMARDIRERVRQETGLAASVGVGRTKLMAKLASEAAKPDGLLIITPDREQAFLSPLPVGDLWGVGAVTEERLQRIGIRTVGELAAMDLSLLREIVGSTLGTTLSQLANGIDHRAVEDNRISKSIGQEETFASDRAQRSQLEPELWLLAEGVAQRLRSAHRAARGVSVKVKYSDFTALSRSHTSLEAIDDAPSIYQVSRRLLSGIDISPGVRLLGISTFNFSDAVQGQIFTEEVSHPGVSTVTTMPPAPWQVGSELHHPVHGLGWVESEDENWVSLRFESWKSGPGPVRVFDRKLLEGLLRNTPPVSQGQDPTPPSSQST